MERKWGPNKKVQFDPGPLRGRGRNGTRRKSLVGEKKKADPRDLAQHKKYEKRDQSVGRISLTKTKEGAKQNPASKEKKRGE